MGNYDDLRIILDLFETILHFGEREVVQRQLIVFAGVVIGAAVLALLLRLLTQLVLGRWFNLLPRLQARRVMRYTGHVLRRMLYPAFTLIGLYVAQSNFVGQGWHVGLLSRFILLFWAYLAYRIFVGLLTARIGAAATHRYQYRFLAPLFGVVAAGWVISHLIPISKIASIVIWEGFTNPITLGALLIATLGFYFWFDGSGVAQDVARSIVKPYLSADAGAVEAFLIIGRYVMIAIGVYVVFVVLGFDSTTLAFLTGGLSVGIGFGSKEIIGNLISGVLLLFDQSLRPGDIISIDGQMGTVRDVGIRATTVRTLNHVELVIPNQTFMMAPVTTYTKTDRLVRVLIDIETADAHSPHAVRDALMSAAAAHEQVVDEPAPTVFYHGSGDTSYRYTLAIWIEDPLLSTKIASEVYFNVYDEFEKQGIQPSTPARDLAITRMPWGDEGSAIVPTGAVQPPRPLPESATRTGPADLPPKARSDQ